MRRKLFLLAVVVAACGEGEKNPISVSGPGFISALVIYPLGDETISLQAITKTALNVIPDFRNFDTPPDSITVDGYQVAFSTSNDSSFIPPQVILVAPEFLQIEEDEVTALASVTKSIQLILFGNSDNVVQKQLAINRFIAALTSNKNVVIADFSAYQGFNPTTWEATRVNNLPVVPNVNDQIVFHTYRDGEYCRIVSMGMSKFALPEISVQRIPCANQEQFGYLMNGLAQTLLETRTILSDSSILLDVNQIKNEEIRNLLIGDRESQASAKAEVNVKSVVPQEGDNLYRQLEVVFTDKSLATRQEEQQQLLEDLFGKAPGGDH